LCAIAHAGISFVTRDLRSSGFERKRRKTEEARGEGNGHRDKGDQGEMRCERNSEQTQGSSGAKTFLMYNGAVTRFNVESQARTGKETSRESQTRNARGRKMSQMQDSFRAFGRHV
jgi:hypothetical protein